MSRKPSAIITADIHLRDDIPRARTDDFWEAQNKKIDFILDLQNKYDGIPVLDGGDFLHKWKSSPYLENWIIRKRYRFKDLDYGSVITIPGTHDTPNHNIKYLKESSLCVLEASGIIRLIKSFNSGIPINCDMDDSKLYSNLVFGYPWGKLEDIKNKKIEISKDWKGRKVLILHTYACKQGSKWFAPDSTNSHAILRMAPQFDLIISGHNHESFVIKQNGRLLVNPGSMMRTTTKQIDHKPRVYLWYAKENEVEPIYLPIEKNVLSTEHIEKQKEKNMESESFIKRLKEDYEIKLSFKSNLCDYFISNPTRKSVEDETYKSLGE